MQKNRGSKEFREVRRCESLLRSAIKCVPFAEQVILLAMLPVGAGINPCASLLFRGYRCKPCTVLAVRCACGGVASGTNFRGMGWVMSTVLKG